MNIEIINKLDEITSLIENDKENIRLNELKNMILNDNKLRLKIDKLKQIDEYGKEYLKIKKEILNNDVYKEYVDKEISLNYLIREINKKLNEFRETGGCK